MTESDDSSNRTGSGGGSNDRDGARPSSDNGEGNDREPSRVQVPAGADPASQLEDRPTGEERVGEVLSRRYRLTEFLGSGAMGEVFRAEHALMKKTVAVKILHSDVSGRAKTVERFRREAQAAANIDHPNVCVATDFGQTAEHDFFLVMEFLEGPTLKDCIGGQGAFEVGRALYIANQIVSALVRAHEVGVVHRDLKPDNIMLIERGEDTDFVKILDFGIARVRMDDETPELTKTGAVFGTPSYMSPEQAAGDPVDHRTDLYAIGSLLFEMLTGRRVFEGDRGAEVMAKHVSNEPPEPSNHAPHDEMRPELEELILELLEKDPEDRPQTALDLHQRLLALESFEEGRALPGLPSGVSVARSSSETEEEAVQPDDASGGVPRVLHRLAEWFERHDAGTRRAVVALAVVAVAMSAILLGLTAAHDTAPSARARAQQGAQLSLVEQRQGLKQRPAVREALREYDRGAIRSGIERLKRLDAEPFRDNPHLEFLIGRGYAELGDWEKSLARFGRVLELEPRYVENRRFLEHLLRAFRAEDGSALRAARELVEPRLDRRRVRSALGRMAWRSSVPRARRRAYEMLERAGVVDELPEWMQASIALRRADGCAEHRRRIEAIVELGDPRALGILRSYAAFPDSVVGCVRDEISGAIRTLEEARDADG